MDKIENLIGVLIFVSVLILVIWFIFGHPIKTIANWFWPEENAPWENVHAFYYPNRYNLTNDKRLLDIGSLEACRDWVDEQFQKNYDNSYSRGDYECGIGCEDMGGGYKCRLTIH